jgi:hypothetical protein
MSLRKALANLARVVADEADKNPDFARRVAEAIGLESAAGNNLPAAGLPSRPKNKRAAAVLDPVALARQGELALRQALRILTVDQLRDIVAEYGMDTGKLVLKWKTPEKIIDRIVEISMPRSQKGDAFRSE